MAFFSARCPNCGKSISKNADYCNHCGCPSATAWADCTRCGASVGSDSQHCWKCGEKQNLEARRSIYFDRWQRSPEDFAIRVDLTLPDKTLHHGLQVEHGTLALLFRNGVFQGTLEPGYHEMDSFWSRLMGKEGGGLAHAILLDAQSAEVDFFVDRVRTRDGVDVDARLRLLFKVTDPKMFAEKFLVNRTTFTVQDMSDAFFGYVREAVQEAVAGHDLESLLEVTAVREWLEGPVVRRLESAFGGAGLKTDGVRLADLGGQTVDTLKEKLGDLQRQLLERELDRRLRSASSQEKVSLFQEQQDLDAFFEQATHDLGLKSAEREEQRKRFFIESEKSLQLLGLRFDWSIASEQAAAEIALREKYLEAEIQENARRAEGNRLGQEKQAATDLEVAKLGLEALKLANEVKMAKQRSEEELAFEMESKRIELRGNATLQGLLATLDGPQADRLMKLTEMQMRQGMTAEQSLAFVAEKAPQEFAPAVAAALKAKFGRHETPPDA